MAFYTNASPTLNYPLLVDSSIYDRSLEIGPVSLSGALEDVAFWCNEVLIPADVNGDGLSDQACFSSVGDGFVRVRLATLDGFDPAQTWLAGKKFKRPMLGDFDADGKMDVADHATLGGAVSVGLSDGGAFAMPVSWGIAGDPGGGLCAGNSGDTFNVATGDFNGDGLTDVSCRKLGTPGIYVGLSTGGALSFAKWATLSCDEQNYYGSGASDFDGDGKDDYYCVGSTGNFVVWASTGSGFQSGVVSGLTSFSTSPAFADLNGDGKTDLANKNGKLALSTGKGFTVLGANDGWCQYDQLSAVDVDGDGASELVCNKNGIGTNDIQVRKWKAGALAAAETWRASWCDGQVFPGDYDGDGKTDLVCNKQAATRAIAGTSGNRADLLVSIGNGLGGTTQVAYTPGTTFHDPTANTPVVKQVVAQITTLDGRGGQSTRSYSYAGAFYNRPERRFMGFRYMKETLPCITGESLCPYNETWLLQDLNSAGKVDEFHRRDGQGRLLASSKYEYATNGTTLPRTSLLTSEWTYIGDATLTTWPGTWPSSAAKRTRSVHSYDSYGNRTQTVSHGDYDSTGDETTTAWEYRPNGTTFIVGAVARTRVFAGTSTLGTLLTETRNLYDGSQAWDAPASDGLLTGSQAWLDTESRFVTKGFGYDAYGNLTSATDETNRTTTTAYDATYRVFPVSVTNNAGETVTTAWDPVCGVPSSSIDLNGQVATLQTDALCRSTRIDFPLGNFQQVSYLSLGDPNSQRVRVERPSASPSDGTGNDYTVDYTDGLGRTYLAVKKGPSTSQTINTETTYNARGGVASQTAPYYTGGTKYWTSYEYDSFDRARRTLLPDGNDVETAFALLATTSYDPNDKPITARFDVFGRTVEKEVTLNGNPVLTQYSYDLLGRMVGIQDSVGTTWVYSFDSLVRNYAKDDPDAGNWTYEFDDAGRQEAVVDAKGQRTEFAYDLAGRLQTKTILGTPNQVTTFTYGEVRAGYFNLGQLTTVTSPADILRTDYDAAGRVVKQTRIIGSTTSVAERRYDAAGRVLGITYPDGDAVGTPASPLAYDSAGRLKAIPSIVSSVAYDAAGRPLVQTNANGTVSTRSYDPERGSLTGIQTMKGATTIQNLAYTLDPAGLVQQVTSPFANESWSYSYDDLYRLVQATNVGSPTQSQTWSYDEIGRITYNSRVGNYTYPALGQPRPHAPQNAGPNSYSYDANGNMLGGAGRTIAWTKDNLPASVTVGSTTTSFTYGGLGDRIQKQTDSNATYYPFGDDFEVSGTTATKYVSVPGLGVVAKRVNTSTFWLHTDRLGSVVAITDASGAVAQRRSFRPYGETLSTQTSHVESRGWIDQRNDAETGLTYLHARYYDPVLAVFLSPDPSNPWYPGVGGNRYAYAHGRPVDLTDRSGLETLETCVVWANTDYCSLESRSAGPSMGPAPDVWDDDWDWFPPITDPWTPPQTGPGGEGPAGLPVPVPVPAPTPEPGATPAPGPTPAPVPSPKPTPKPKTQAEKKKAQRDKLDRATKDAKPRLGTSSCNAFFGGNALRDFAAARIVFHSGTGGKAARVVGGVIRINPSGPFMNDQYTVAHFGPAGSLSFESNDAFASFILLHELAHTDSEDTIFLADGDDPDMTYVNSLRLYNACY